MLAHVTPRKWRLLCNRAQRLGSDGSGESSTIPGQWQQQESTAPQDPFRLLCPALSHRHLERASHGLVALFSDWTRPTLPLLLQPIWVQTVSFVTLA